MSTILTRASLLQRQAFCFVFISVRRWGRKLNPNIDLFNCTETPFLPVLKYKCALSGLEIRSCFKNIICKKGPNKCEHLSFSAGISSVQESSSCFLCWHEANLAQLSRSAQFFCQITLPKNKNKTNNPTPNNNTNNKTINNNKQTNVMGEAAVLPKEIPWLNIHSYPNNLNITWESNACKHALIQIKQEI